MTLSGATPTKSKAATDSIDFDLHGLVSVRLVGPTISDAAAVRRQLGPVEASREREPDIVVRFVDRLAQSSTIRYIGLDDAGFTDDAFLVLRSRNKSPARVKIDFSQIGGPTEVVCERGLSAVPFLVPILNLTLLAKGVLPLHASAFVHEGTGVVATGWSKGGKTEALLAFTARGAEYVGDEWVYVTSDGSRVHGIPEPIRIWRWQLRQLPQYESFVARRERARLDVLELARRAEKWRHPIPGRVSSLLTRQQYVDVDPERLFGRLGTMTAPFDRLFFLVGHERSDVTVAPIDPSEVARRMTFSLLHENLDLTAAYFKFRFAFPDSSSYLVDHAATLQREAIGRVLAGKPTFAVHHPYPVSLDALFTAMDPYCG